MSPLQVLDQIAVPFAQLYRENTAHSFSGKEGQIC